ncbi:non-heme iron oxygenase ferredoxin subunit [Noviherbaspirillum cavernae]|uniref:Non-heme iron oxygenase ferredoxin subunit n=1 Tax=Noviherbaspirillum cavernae TaxID=2320862 RepID=A0A418X6E6_9BURK|nr:non-heme iron oxygenase ferredoxin subunit [Noviherbaspirillum cavernae]RJG08020.1 non-heme iron oxygenase ferredoxin subunit [Noviherbaspirillum cavernae]
MSTWINVAAVSQIADGGFCTVDIDGTDIAVFNLDDEFFAIEDICTHDGGILTGGSVEGDQVICPRHGARFSIRTGAALAPPAYEPVVTFPVRVKDGMVQVRDNRWD